MNELLSKCPFCGQTATLTRTIKTDIWNGDEQSSTFSIRCTGCGCETESSVDSQETIDKWNRRTPDESVIGEIRKYSIDGADDSTFTHYVPVAHGEELHFYDNSPEQAASDLTEFFIRERIDKQRQATLD